MQEVAERHRGADIETTNARSCGEANAGKPTYETK
jgi:hypothetical protein